MARLKQSIWQRSFRFMEVRKELLEADDTDIRLASLWSARNMRGISTGTLAARPGLCYRRQLTTGHHAVEISPASGLRFSLIINDDSIEIIDSRANLVETISPVPWTDASDVWVQSFREQTVMGGAFGIHTLDYNGGAWSLGEFAFEPATGGEVAQPYWVYEKGVSITPSARDGNITITASAPIWTAGYVGLRIRYAFREILITEFINSSVLRGTVVTPLPPSFAIIVENHGEFRVGEAVVSADTNFQGIVSAKFPGNILYVQGLEFFEGPDVGEELASTGGSSKITSITEVSPVASEIWDEPLMSDLRGWPRSAAVASGRLILLDFAAIPDMIACSSSRSIEDFKVGAADDDAIVRRVGDNAPRWLHAVNQGDLLLMADNGISYVPLRERGTLSPSTFNLVTIDNTGASAIRPVRVEDGVIFVNAGGEGVSAALLDGNIYLKWSIRSMTEYHNHLINSPRALCGPSLTSGDSEKYVFVINADGTLAAISWQESIRDEQIGFAPWDTQGTFVNVVPMFDAYWAIVDRSINGSTVRYLEEFRSDCFLDASVTNSGESGFVTLEVNGEALVVNGEALMIAAPFLLPLAGEPVAVYSGGYDFGDFEVSAAGVTTENINADGIFEAGFNFVSDVKPWPTEIISSPRIGTFSARTLTAMISVQDTITFKGIMNGVERRVGGYNFGDDLTEPPQPVTKVFRFAVFGNRDHPEIIFRKDRPGPFNVLAVGQEVQA